MSIAEWCVEVRDLLNPNGERAAPAPFWYPGHPVSWEEPAPTGGEGSYDQFFDW